MTDSPTRPLHRCLMFVPGSRPELLEKAHRSGADALIFDLEDSVPPTGEEQARRNVAQALLRPSGLPVFVRPNNANVQELADDIEALAAAGCGDAPWHPPVQDEWCSRGRCPGPAFGRT